MRAWEIITEDQTGRPEISLRHLNQLKHMSRARAASDARRDRLVRTIYANPAREHERIEFEKAKMELAQQKAELVATRAEAQAEPREAIADLAKAGTETEQRHRAKVVNMARTELRLCNTLSI